MCLQDSRVLAGTHPHEAGHDAMVEGRHPELHPARVCDGHRNEADVEQQQEGVQGLGIHLMASRQAARQAGSQAGGQAAQDRGQI